MDHIQEGDFRPANRRRAVVPKSGSIRAFLSGLLIGAIITGGTVYVHMSHEYVKVFKTNIGGFVFYSNKIYNLSELKNL